MKVPQQAFLHARRDGGEAEEEACSLSLAPHSLEPSPVAASKSTKKEEEEEEKKQRKREDGENETGGREE